MSDEYVYTPYGRVPGCPECGRIPLAGALLCEHGVVPEPRAEVSLSVIITDRVLYDRLLGSEEGVSSGEE